MIVVALGFVTLAFLLAARLLIRDFFSIDMWRSLNFVLDFCWRTLVIEQSRCQTVRSPAYQVHVNEISYLRIA